MPSDPPPVEVIELVKVYGEVTAVDGISFRLERGTVTALLGGNGAGKTTTISMIMGLVTATSGTARVFGWDMGRDRHRVLYRMNFESPYTDIPMRLTVAENLEVFGRIYGVADLETRKRRVADDLRIADLMARPYGKLSAGQRTRVSLAKGLLNDPELLLLDEPTASLDPDTADWVRSHIESYARERGATVMLASHNMSEVERLAARVIMLDRGRILADASPAELIRRYGRSDLEGVFLAIARREDGRLEGAPDDDGTERRR